MARQKDYISDDVYQSFRARYKECIRMLNGLEKTLERKLPERERRWFVSEHADTYTEAAEATEPGWPI